MNRYFFLLRWLPSILWMAAIFYSSSRTGDDLGGLLDRVKQWLPFMKGFDWGHFVAYYGLALTFLWGWHPKRISYGVIAGVVLLCLIYGLTDEYHQAFVPGRTPDWKDLRNDGIGAMLAMLTAQIQAIKRRFVS